MALQIASVQISLDFDNRHQVDVTPPVVPLATMPWIKVAPGVPYFITDQQKEWMPIGQNDGITWPDLEGIFKKKNIAPRRIFCLPF